MTHTLPPEACLLIRTHNDNSSMETHTGPFQRGERDLGTHDVNSDIMTAPVCWQRMHGNIHRIHYKNSNMTIFTLWHMKCSFIHILYEMGHRDTFRDNSNMLTQREGEKYSQNEIHMKTMSKQNTSSPRIQKWWTERENTDILSNPWTCQWPNDPWMTRRNAETWWHSEQGRSNTVHRYTVIVTPSFTGTFWRLTPPPY